METYTEPKDLTENPDYKIQRQETLAGLSYATIDAPIIELIKGLNELPCCFTMQSCYGHFLFKGHEDLYNLDPLPAMDAIDLVEYRIAYIALCIENSGSGRRLLDDLNTLTGIDPENIQFCCAGWFWEKQVNSYALQVEPDRFKHQDKAILDYREALKIEKIRDKFFTQLGLLLERQPMAF